MTNRNSSSKPSMEELARTIYECISACKPTSGWLNWNALNGYDKEYYRRLIRHLQTKWDISTKID